MRRTVVYLLLLAAVMGAYYYLKNKPATIDTTTDIAVTLAPQTPTSFLFSTTDGQPIQFQIASSTGETVELARNTDQAWEVKIPIEAAADQGSAEEAASQITAIQIANELPTSVGPGDIGLDQPAYTITVKYDSGVERKAEIGVITTSGNGYYAQTSDNKLVIVSRSGIDSLIGLLINPPYLETLTPSPISPTATETPLPSSTPEPVTPTEPPATPTP